MVLLVLCSSAAALAGSADRHVAGVPVLAVSAAGTEGAGVWPGRFTLLDYGVLAAYGAMLLGLGWYYGRRSRSMEAYLLGGRRMVSSAVGLSLFATLLSTISYLATPGEMINKGPVILWCMVSDVIAYFVVGYLLIPHFMRLPVTSAYEILERPLGLRIRLLASAIFLVARLVWMGLIVYVLTDKILVVILGWPASATPYLALAIGVITIVYTSVGGLQAVVWAGVLQTFILLGAAVLTIVLISIQMGGVAAWFPTEWSPSWDDQPLFRFDLTHRATVIGSIVFMTVWWICTAGSDQLAIQRYLSTRDADAARKAFRTTCIADICVTLCLGVLGFALLGFFRAHPQHLAEAGFTIARDADKLLPHYIMRFLPTGARALAIAGMLAAAMSSLSAGINSCCSVICVDFIDRFRTASESDAQRLRRIKVVSVLTGVVVVLLSFLMGKVSGNLNEVAVRITHVFVAPLFGLFFMALFIPFATPLGTGIGALAGCATAILIAYWDIFTGGPALSFQWISVLALIVNLAVAIPLSALTARSHRACAEPTQTQTFRRAPDGKDRSA